jgi:hypothetical protein
MYIEILESMLLGSFYDDSYSNGILTLRKELISDKTFQTNWNEIKSLIREKGFSEGKVFEIILTKAGQPLYEKSDNEAYRWLELMILNIESNSKIIEY